VRINIHKLTKHIPCIDSDFALLLSQGASPAHLEAFLVRNYLPVAYIFAFRMNRTLRDNEALQDKVSDSAVEVIDEMAQKIRTGRLGFRGESRFSTYLWAAMKRRKIDRLYIPRNISLMKPEACTAYRLLFSEGRSSSECRQILMAEEGLEAEAADDIIKKVLSATSGVAIVPQEEVPADLEDPSWPPLLSKYDGPETAYIKQVLQSRVECVLAEMPDEDREILELRYIGACSIREIGRKMKLKSPQYRYEQAREIFLECIRIEGLDKLYKTVCEKETEYGLA